MRTNEQIAEAVAQELSVLDGEWAVDGHDTTRLHITHTSTGQAFLLLHDRWGNKARFETFGIYHVAKDGTRFYPYDTWTDGVRDGQPSITFTDTKTPRQMALDIYRRFLPDYRTAWNKTAERCREWDESRQNNRNGAIIAAKILGIPMPKAGDGSGKARCYSAEHGSCDVECYGDTVNIDLNHVSRETMAAVLEAYKGSTR